MAGVEEEVAFPFSPLFEELQQQEMEQQAAESSSSSASVSLPAVLPNVSGTVEGLGVETPAQSLDDSDSDTLIGDFEVLDEGLLDE